MLNVKFSELITSYVEDGAVFFSNGLVIIFCFKWTSMRTEQPTKCFVPLQKTEGEVGAVKHV